jgi:hypothetical protein
MFVLIQTRGTINIKYRRNEPFTGVGSIVAIVTGDLPLLGRGIRQGQGIVVEGLLDLLESPDAVLKCVRAHRYS